MLVAEGAVHDQEAGGHLQILMQLQLPALLMLMLRMKSWRQKQTRLMLAM